MVEDGSPVRTSRGSVMRWTIEIGLVALVIVIVLFQDQLAGLLGDDLALILSAIAPAVFALGASLALGRPALLSLSWAIPLAAIAGVGVALLPAPWGLVPVWISVLLSSLLLFSNSAVAKWQQIIGTVARRPVR